MPSDTPVRIDNDDADGSLSFCHSYLQVPRAPAPRSCCTGHRASTPTSCGRA